ncbi:MAG: hypothetical protein ACP5E3_19990, partial [Bacteroidales bacterium]
MKSIILPVFFILGFSLNISAQQKPEVIETAFQYQDKKAEGFKTSIPEVKPDDVEANWIKTIEKGTRSKVNLKSSYNMSL